MNVWQRQRLDGLRRSLVALLERRAEAVDVDSLRYIDAEIAECCRAIADAEFKLKVEP